MSAASTSKKREASGGASNPAKKSKGAGALVAARAAPGAAPGATSWAPDPSLLLGAVLALLPVFQEYVAPMLDPLSAYCLFALVCRGLRAHRDAMMPNVFLPLRLKPLKQSRGAWLYDQFCWTTLCTAPPEWYAPRTRTLHLQTLPDTRRRAFPALKDIPKIFGRRFARLTELRVSGYALTDASLAALAACFPNLTWLHLSMKDMAAPYRGLVTCKGIRAVFEHCKGLRHLTLRGMPLISRELLNIVAVHAKALRALHLLDNPKIVGWHNVLPLGVVVASQTWLKEEAKKPEAERETGLQHLTLVEDQSGMSLHALERLARAFPNMHALHLPSHVDKLAQYASLRCREWYSRARGEKMEQDYTKEAHKEYEGWKESQALCSAGNLMAWAPSVSA